MKSIAQRFRLRSVTSLVAMAFATQLAWAVDPFTVRDIRVEGLQRVEPGTVFASLPVRVGETYNDEKGAAAIRSLFGLGLFNDVRLEVQGDVLVVEFTVLGLPCLGLNGGPAFRHSEAFSFQVATTTQEETDRYWNAIVGHGGQESACGWCKDRWGISWQITPVQLTRAWTHPDRAAAKRAFDAMMTMRKIDIAAIEAAVARR